MAFRCRTFLVLALVAAMSLACASSPKHIRAGLGPWVGQHVNNLIAAWGPPSSTYDLPFDVAAGSGGGRVYTWLYVGNAVASITDYPYINTTIVNSGREYCKIDWTVSGSGRIENFRWEGSCRVMKLR